MAELAEDTFVVASSPRKLLVTLLELTAFTAGALWLALTSSDVLMGIAVVVLAALLLFALTRRPWSRSAVLTVTDSGLAHRRGPTIPWADIENVALRRSGRVWKRTTLAIWVRPTASYVTGGSRIAGIRRIGKRLMPGVATLAISSTAVDVPLDRAMTEITVRSGEPWASR
jgi:hypothetical protein